MLLFEVTDLCLTIGSRKLINKKKNTQTAVIFSADQQITVKANKYHTYNRSNSYSFGYYFTIIREASSTKFATTLQLCSLPLTYNIQSSMVWVKNKTIVTEKKWNFFKRTMCQRTDADRDKKKRKQSVDK